MTAWTTGLAAPLVPEPLSSRFGVFFLQGGLLPNPVDFRFAKVSGLTSTLATTPLLEGGANLVQHALPDRVTYGNVVLERGVVVGSPLHLQLVATFTALQVAPVDVIVALLGERGEPLTAWMLHRALPVSWSVADLDAASPAIAVESLELAVTRMTRLAV